MERSEKLRNYGIRMEAKILPHLFSFVLFDSTLKVLYTSALIAQLHRERKCQEKVKGEAIFAVSGDEGGGFRDIRRQ